MKRDNLAGGEIAIVEGHTIVGATTPRKPRKDTGMTAPDKVIELVGRFESNLDAYKGGKYNETQVRREFIDPLFVALGWDVANEGGYSEAYKDVVHEDAIKVAGATKAPDYCFRIGGTRKFFLEAKKPSINIKDDTHPAYQLRRYAWSAKLPLSILTDFEELGVYDCRPRPVQTDKPSTARVMYLTYADYIDRWDEIAGIFSRVAILKGSFDKYVESHKAKRGTAEVDAAFLEEIERWREALARNIALRNPNLSTRELNFAVQRTIDRVIFLRISEARGIEPYGALRDLQSGRLVYDGLTALFRQADDRYNSGIFHFTPESGRPDDSLDRLTPGLTIDDKVLKDILKSLYYPDSPYEFSVLPADILGQVYEQFLGKVIRLTVGHRAKVEEKPEVKKAGGVYYTPTYIVDYIVKGTVGRLLGAVDASEDAVDTSDVSETSEVSTAKPMTPADVAKLRILDPACGSGSFLIGAYQFLLDWHRDYYRAHNPGRWAKGKNPRIYQAGDAEWHLTTAERKRILLDNIYGVDIDSQAVEVTKLSLLLKVLEGEHAGDMATQLSFMQERALPDLRNNIKCGNSLIGTDFYDGRQTTFFDDEEAYRVNPFDWEAEFPQIMAAGGFDAVIGNPPYRRERDYKHLMDEIASTPFGRRYRSPRMDFWYYFVHRGIELLRLSGVLGYIVNAYWTAGTGAHKLISALRNDAHIDEIFSFGKLRVFQKVSGQHMILLVSNAPRDSTVVKIAQPDSEKTAQPFVEGLAPILVLEKTAEQLFCGDKVDLEPSQDELLSKLDKWPPLSEFGKVRQGIAENPASINRKTNAKYGNPWEIGQGVFALRADEVDRLNLPPREKELLRPYWDLSDLGRYYIAEAPSLHLFYSTRSTCPDIRAYPTILEHLAQFRAIMEKRRETRKGSNKWWHLHWPRDESLWRTAKVLSVQMAERPSFLVSTQPVYVSFSVNVFVPFSTTKEHLNYITGLLNSRLLWRWYQHHAKRRGVGLEINGNVLSRTPIRTIDFDDPDDKARHDQMVLLVGRMLSLHKQLAGASTPHAKAIIERQIAATDRQIDRLVYELYGLMEEEVNVVEGGI